MIEEEINKENEIVEEPIAKSNFDEVPEQEVVDDKKKKKDKDGKKPLWRKILDWVITGVFGLAAVGAVAIMIGTKVNPDGMFLGYMFPQVLTDSMADKYPVGSVLIVKQVDPSEVQIGDAVTFKYPVNGVEMNMTHEIFKIEYTDPIYNEDGICTNDGYYTFYAHGTNKHSEFCKIKNEKGEEVYGDCTDITVKNNVQEFHQKKLVGKVERSSPVLAVVFKVVQSPIGLIVLILLPCLYLMVTSVIDMFKKIPDDEEEAASGGGGNITVRSVKRADGSDPLAGLSDEEKERLKKQMLDELLGKKGGK